MKKISIIIADDHVLFIDGLRVLFQNEESVEVVDVANNGRELLEKLKHQSPDVILLDINMPLMNGLESARQIQLAYPLIRVIVLSTYNEEHLIEKARSAGAKGYLLKNCSKSELLETIRLVVAGNLSFPAKDIKKTDPFSDQDKFLRQFNLTKREYEIVQLIKLELTNQEIANKLFLSIYTVETHRKNIMQKLGLNKPAALMKFIVENNL
jgi:two-component system, NarL family, nitrate/nitrite response regulator NarL